MRRGSYAALVATCAALAACARAAPPPGGDLPRVPPEVVSTTPGHLETIDPGAGPVVFRFDRRISEQGIQGIVQVSPETGEIRIDRGRSEIRVSLEGGWRPNTVYRVVLQPGVRDLFGNQRRYPTEVVFSTGPPIQETALAGLVIDRITGRPSASPAVRVEAVSDADSTAYVEIPDREGIFAMRYLPEGAYRVRAYVDQNRNRRLDPNEARGETDVVLSVGDTVLVELQMLAPDSTPAQLARAAARDSATVVLTFDDYMDPEAPPGVEVRVWRLADGAEVAVDTVLYPHEDEARLAELWRSAAAAAPADTAAGDGGPGDAVPADDGAPGDAAGPTDEPAQGTGDPDGDADPDDGAAEPQRLLPVRELIVVLAAPLEYGAEYAIEVQGVMNINGLPGGGGQAEFVAPQPPPPPPEPEPDDAAQDAGAAGGTPDGGAAGAAADGVGAGPPQDAGAGAPAGAPDDLPAPPSDPDAAPAPDAAPPGAAGDAP